MTCARVATLQRNAEWDRPLRLAACDLCDWGRDLVEPDRFCSNPEVVGRRKYMLVEDARKRGGPCGPDAEHLTIKGDRLC